MNSTLRFLAVLCLISVIAAPASAFTADSLSINVLENGDATVTFSYSLGWAEKFAVFFRIADPANELKNALESNFGKEVSVQEVTDNSAAFMVSEYAHLSDGEHGVTYTTPAISFASAEKILSGYWFAPLIAVDLSPAETTVAFPDGYAENFYDAIDIPKISHTISIA
ncbi:hypothetical protein [Methanogenium organophilum]|uniref:Uncharacterized protein n=1 Tax=Methanogenium organophilum TaxID=2199 RepID=A0A9X9S390_METOG|nr:hypothetical protein [Methanogenium organophilum]WAI00703.1 hypothetical protein OU421_09740 [Methanogenium organophilum]